MSILGIEAFKKYLKGLQKAIFSLFERFFSMGRTREHGMAASENFYRSASRMEFLITFTGVRKGFGTD
jgi:hypothetical protein